jgi:hypothetical protein
MSNYLAVATVTASIAQILLNSFHTTRPAISGATVTTGRPESVKADSSFVGVNLYLYQISPNIAYRNSDLSTRNSDGKLLQRPQVALDLNYLLTFYGSESGLESQLLLGCTVSALNARPVLTREVIEEAIKHNKGSLAQSDLASQIESVKLTPLYLNLDEWSKLWTVFFQETHVLSVCYQCSVVLIDADLPVPAPALPVRTANIQSSAALQPFVEEVGAQGGADAAIVPGTTLHMTGQSMRGITRMKVLSEAESLLIYTDPIIGATQPVSVMLNEVSSTSPASYNLSVGSRAGDSNHVSVSLAGVQAGTYLVRISVDGAESPLEVDTNPKSPTFNRYVRPRVVIP